MTDTDNASSTREDILEEALTMFSEHGFEAVSVRDICARVGVNHGLIKYYFGDKETLWREVVQVATSRLYQSMEAHLGGYSTGVNSPVEAMERWIRGYVYAAATNSKYMRLLSCEALRHSDRLDWLIKVFFKPNHKDGFTHLQAVMDAGVLPQVSPVFLFYIVSSAIQAPFVVAPKLLRIHGVDITQEEAIKAHADALVALLLRKQDGTVREPVAEAAPKSKGRAGAKAGANGKAGRPRAVAAGSAKATGAAKPSGRAKAGTAAKKS